MKKNAKFGEKGLLFLKESNYNQTMSQEQQKCKTDSQLIIYLYKIRGDTDYD